MPRAGITCIPCSGHHSKKKLMLHNHKIIRVLFILLMVMTMNLSNVLASTDPDDPSLNDPADIPVDGGISLLLAAGAGLATRKFLGQRRPVQSPPDSDE
jgi:hypothetical protein